MLGRRQLSLLLAMSCLFTHGLLLAYGACRNSPARDEVAHLAAGLSHLEFRQFDLYRVNPPLVRTLAAVPLWLSSADRDWSSYQGGNFDRPEFRVGADFIRNNGENAFAYFTYGRLMCIPFSLLGGWLCFRWSSELFGPASAVIAVALWCFLPEVIANGQLLTPDMAATSLGALFWYLLWRWQQQPTWRGSAMAGIALGFALLAKATWIAAFPLLLLLSWRGRARWAQLAGIVVISLYVLNLGYLFEGTGTPLGEFPFISTALSGESSRAVGNRFADSWIGDVPVPLPRNFVLGIDVQKYEFDDREYTSYLRGEWQWHGWWYYYLYGLAVKTPVGCLALLGFAICVVPKRWPTFASGPKFDLLILVLPGIAILGLVSSQTGFNHHLRYVLPATPYWLILASGAYVALQSVQMKRLVLLLVGVSCVSSLFCFPHHQSYFNEVAGGPMQGAEHLVNSNVDWGQDMHRVRDWLREHPHAKPLQWVVHANYDVRTVATGSDWVFPGEVKAFDEQGGWFAISVNDLKDMDDRYSALHDKEPVDFVGYSTRIFHIAPDHSEFSEQFGGITQPQHHLLTDTSHLQEKIAWESQTQ